MGSGVFNAIKAAEMNLRGAYGGEMVKQMLDYLNAIRNAAHEEKEREQEHVITLCGSTRFYKNFKDASPKLYAYH